MELTQEERDILAHVVIDPDAWVEHALKTVGEKAVTAKVERWRPVYLTEKDLPDYKNRAERDAIEAIKPVPTAEEEALAISEQAKKDLVDIDIKSIRSMREWLVAQPDAPQYLIDYEVEATEKRNKIK